jgi:hypothetical protein
VFLKDFLEICANICSTKLLVLAKEGGSIQPGSGDFRRKGEMCKYIVWCPSTGVNISRYHTPNPY